MFEHAFKSCGRDIGRLPPADTVIINAQLADGTGAPLLRNANVRIVADRIAKIGDFEPTKSDRVIDAAGLVLAPGFIDITQSFGGGYCPRSLCRDPGRPGITTVILGPDGFSPWPIGSWLADRRKAPAALNLAVMVGHATVRKQVMGEDYKRSANPGEVDRMVHLVDEAMHEGAIGLSSGLEYEIANYSTTDEVVALASTAARDGGFYMTHIRDEADKSFAALQEEIAIGELAHIPIEHSHIKLGTTSKV